MDLNIFNIYGKQMHAGILQTTTTSQLTIHKTMIGEKAKQWILFLSIVDSMN